MKFLRKFNEHTSYEAELNVGGEEFKIPNVSYCDDIKDVHFNPYNLIKFYVGEITGTTPQTVSIYTDGTNHLDVSVSEGNKWYSYVLPKDKGLSKIEGDSVKKLVVKADMANYNADNDNGHFPSSIIEASFKGSNTSNVTYMGYMFDGCDELASLDLSGWNTSNVTDMNSMFQDCSGLISLDLIDFNTSNVTDMNYMFYGCSGLTSLDLSSFNTSNVTDMGSMFEGCINLKTITMKDCTDDTINKIQTQLTTDGITGVTITTK